MTAFKDHPSGAGVIEMCLSETLGAHGRKNMKFIECSNTVAQSAEIERRRLVRSNLEPRLVLLTSEEQGRATAGITLEGPPNYLQR